jgi:hypothetical protein
MSQDENEGIAYLMALRQAAAAAPAREASVENPSHDGAPVEENFQGAEKRRSPRYKCEGSAEIRKDGCDVHTWSTFTDISLHGCYVEAQATYPAGTLLHMKLEANGVRVETKGKVRVSYPYLGMGIAFEDVSDESAAHLKQLLAALSRPGVIMGVQASHPSAGPMDPLPEINKPEAVIAAVIEFFEMHQVLMRDDFMRLVKKSQE